MSQRLRRIAARLRATAIKKVNAKSVFHMPTSPAGAIFFFIYSYFFLNSSFTPSFYPSFPRIDRDLLCLSFVALPTEMHNFPVELVAEP